ncbi:MAG: NADH-quinone oxidoreductase subunit NuoK [Bdellovibrionota bacterium]
MVSIEHYLILATVVFFCGMFAVLFRRNIIFMMMGIELMLNAVNIVFVSASNELGHLDGQIMVFFVVTVAACEAAIGLAMVIAIFRRYGTINTDFLRVLRG